MLFTIFMIVVILALLPVAIYVASLLVIGVPTLAVWGLYQFIKHWGITILIILGGLILFYLFFIPIMYLFENKYIFGTFIILFNLGFWYLIGYFIWDVITNRNKKIPSIADKFFEDCKRIEDLKSND